MMKYTFVFLVFLRLAIGWHFLFEGLSKYHSTEVGETAYNKPFTSAGYFREAAGPLAPAFRWGLGDPDETALALLTVKPVPEKQDRATDKPHERVPPALHRLWQEYLDRFASHYQLDERQRQEAEARLQQAEDNVVNWLEESETKEKTKQVTRTFPTGEVKEQIPTARRIREYRANVEEIRDVLARKLPAFGKDVEGARLRKLKADTAEMRAGLLNDLGEQTSAYHKSLDDVLTKDQKALGPVPQGKKDRLLGWIDWLTTWGLTGVGACLLVGLLTRLNCVLGVGFLLLTYLLYPAFPWLPAPPSEGTYVYVNKNVIEMLALMALATTHSGRWFGVDALLHQLVLAFRGRRPEPAPAAA
jgi:uncharacterized membrane protein YphA (DoxX/SURF4 family)